MSLLSVSHLTMRFGGLVAVDDFNLELEQGRIAGLIGPNGSGKTTVFNVITGFYKPTQGRLFLDGKEITNLSPDRITAMGLTRIFQNSRVFRELSVFDNVMVGDHLRMKSNPFAAVVGTRGYLGHEKRAVDQTLSLLEGLGLIEAEVGGLRPAGGNPLHVHPFWDSGQPEQIRACLQAWRSLSNVGEMTDDSCKCHPDLPRGRQAVLATLQALPAGEWIEPEELLAQVQTNDTLFLFPLRDEVAQHRYGWYYSSDHQLYGAPAALLQAMEKGEGEFLRRLLTGIPFELGLLELGYEGEALCGARLSAAGRAALGQAAVTESPENGARLVVQPNFQLLALGPVRLSLLARLDLFAQREQADVGAFVYHLSRESVYRAQQLGMNVPEIIRFIEEASSTELPQNVRRSLEEWGAHHERIVFRRGVSLLQAADAGTMEKLTADPRTGPAIARTVSPTLALVRPHGEVSLLSALLDRGLLPAMSGAQPEDADRSAVLDGAGTIRSVHAVPSLHLAGRLARWAEERVPNREWQLTPESVRRAGGSREAVLVLLEELGRLVRGELPEELVAQIKAWGGYFGGAAAQALTLVEFRDAEALSELRRNAELRGLLTPFQAGQRALAVVAEGELEKVREILKRYGVEVTDGLETKDERRRTKDEGPRTEGRAEDRGKGRGGEKGQG